MSQTLRKVEKEVLIPRHMERKINSELCKEESRLFHECATESHLLVVTACKQEYLNFAECSNKWFRDEKFREESEKDYLKKREHFRKTGEPFEKSPFKRV